MFDTLFITTLFLLASLLVRLLTLWLNINTKHLSLFSFITDINVFFPTPLSPFIKVNKNLRPLRLFWPPPPFIRYLRGLYLIYGFEIMCRLTQHESRSLMIDSHFITHRLVESNLTAQKLLDSQLKVRILFGWQLAGLHFRITCYFCIGSFLASVLLWTQIK